VDLKNRSIAGAFLFVGAAQYLLLITIASARYPGYSLATNAISDLGVGPTALLFNASTAVFGAFVLIGALVGTRALGPRLAATIAVAGICAIGVALFPETSGAPHSILALLAFVFGAVSALISFRFLRQPLACFAAGLGIISLTALVLELTQHDLGIGKGGMERMVAYPIFIWLLGFGGSLMGAM